LISTHYARFEAGQEVLNFLESLLGLLASASPCGSSSSGTLKLRLEFSLAFEHTIQFAHKLAAIGQPGLFARPEKPIYQNALSPYAAFKVPPASVETRRPMR
jgi:hypothetical protein